MSQLIDKPLTAFDDFRLKEVSNKYRIGFTNIVDRTTRGSDCLTKEEIKAGALVLRDKIERYSPKIAAFNGKGFQIVFAFNLILKHFVIYVKEFMKSSAEPLIFS